MLNSLAPRADFPLLAANPALLATPARVIVGGVRGSLPSQLNSFVEIAGAKADFIQRYIFPGGMQPPSRLGGFEWPDRAAVCASLPGGTSAQS
jgi:hypothetical protein